MDRLRTGGVPALTAGKVSGAMGNVSVVSTRARSSDAALTSDRCPTTSTTSKYGGASPRGSANPRLSEGGEDGSSYRSSAISTVRGGIGGLELSCS